MTKKILLIDDDQSIVEIIRQFLQDEGFEVKGYSDGNDMQTKINKVKPDLLLIDYLLPGKNGAEIIKFVRNYEATKNIPIVMIAANLTYKQQAKSAGANEFLEKPFDMYELLNMIRRYTHSSQRT